mmetsp:Transcript_22272/g.88406  ORF Transcript_22272/g.88406 Transcript_22272/m.88406 type:complete len:226 (+) Transcript_22272:194-871(+)
MKRRDEAVEAVFEDGFDAKAHVGVLADVHRGVFGVLDGEEARARVVEPASRALVEVRAAVADREADDVVVPLFAVEFEELEQERAEVLRRAEPRRAVGAVAVLHEGGDEHLRRERAEPAVIGLVEVALGEDVLDDEDERPQRGMCGHEIVDAPRSAHPRVDAERHVDRHARRGVLELDDGDAGRVDDFDVARDAAAQRVAEPVERSAALVGGAEHGDVDVRGREP